MKLNFFKYQGTGNDFVILDNRDSNLQLSTKQINHICDRKFGIGADGLMLLNTSEGYDFEMKYFNADGHMSSMCGNGGRCMVRFAYNAGIHKDEFSFMAVDGLHKAVIDNNGWINLQMNNVDEISMVHSDSVLNTGSPHYVKQVNNIYDYDVDKVGREIRYSSEFKEEGINVNFVEVEEKKIYVRTYERGVEGETLSCGTGVTAAALVFAHNENGFNRVEVQTPGGHLAVEFIKTGESSFENIWLCGPAEYVFEGVIEI